MAGCGWILLIIVPLVIIAVPALKALQKYIQPASPEDKTNFVQLIFQVLAGIVVIVGVYFTWQEFKTSRETLRNSQETLRTTQQGQITDRFTRAIDQLGKSDDVAGKNNNLSIRLGGIYSLERIARDSLEADPSNDKSKGKSDHWVVVEILTTYVTKNSQWTLEKESETVIKPLPADIQAILTVLGRRALEYQAGENQRLNLRGVDLRGANLNEGKLNGADFQGSHLDEAQLNGTHLNDANLYGVSLKGAFLNNSAQLKNAILQGADLTSAELIGADLFGSNLTGARLAGANLDGADLRCATVSSDQLKSARTLTGAKLPDSQMKCSPN